MIFPTPTHLLLLCDGPEARVRVEAVVGEHHLGAVLQAAQVGDHGAEAVVQRHGAADGVGLKGKGVVKFESGLLIAFVVEISLFLPVEQGQRYCIVIP